MERAPAYSMTISHYQIIKQLGLSGMGEGYLAEDTRLSRKIAINLLPPDNERPELGQQLAARDEQIKEMLTQLARLLES